MRGFFILISVMYIDFAFTNLFLPANCTNLPLLQSHMNNLEKNKNEDSLKLAWSDVKQKLDKIFEGGGAKAAAKQKEKNKLTARQRIAYLCDHDKPFIELGAFAGYNMYEEYGGCPAGGTVSGIGYISGRQCMVVANDQTVKAGAWFPITGKKTFVCRRLPWRIGCR